MMLKYEMKKVFSRSNFKIAVLLLVLLVGITCYFSMDVTFVNNSGVTEHGLSAARKLRTAKKEWAGVLNEKKIQAVMKENAQIASSSEANSDELVKNEIAYSWTQGFSDIRQLLNFAYADNFHEYDYFKADSLTVDMASDFYQNRITLLEDRMNNPSYHDFTTKEKEYIIDKYKDLSTPLYYDYADGWIRLFEGSTTIIMITTLVLGYLVAGIFACEFSWKADSIFFTSFYGRNSAIKAKIKAGMSIVTVLYWPTILLYSAIILLTLGADGAGCMIQANAVGWRSLYNIKIWQEYLLITFGGYIGCMFLSLLTMYVSARTKSAVVAVMTPFVLIFLPSFLSGTRFIILNKIIGLLPDQLLQLNMSLRLFNVYEFGGKVIAGVPIVIGIYSIFAILLVPTIYHTYKHKQIS